MCATRQPKGGWSHRRGVRTPGDRAGGLLPILAGAAFLGLLLPSPVSAAGPDRDDDYEVIIPIDHEAAELLGRAKEAARTGDLSLAATIYRRLLEESAGSVVPAGEGVYRGVVFLAEEGLSALPREGQEVYRRLVESKAAHLLESAIASGSRMEIARVADRYLFSPAGEEACRLLGDIALEAGEFERARRCYLRIVRRYGDPSLAPEELGPRIAEARRLGAHGVKKPGVEKIAPGGLRWERDAHRGADQVQTSGRRPWGRGWHRIQRGSTSRTYFHPSLPLLHDGVVYITGPTSLKAVDLEWGRDKVRRFRPSRLSQYNDINPQALYSVTMDGGRLFGTFVTDVENGEKFRGVGGGFPIDITVTIPVRKVMAFDPGTGRKLWDLRESKDPFVKKASFPAPPTAAGGDVYASAVLMEGYVQSYLVALNARDGQVRWRTLLGSGQLETTMFVYHAREPLATRVTEEGGILYHCTNLGVAAAVRADDGAILWEAAYEIMPVQPAKNYHPVIREIGWGSNAPIVVDDVVVVAPLDSQYLYAFDRESGEVRWSLNRKTSARGRNWNLRYILGAHGGKVLVSGDKAVAIRARDGVVAWEGPDVTSEAYEMRPAGRGAVVGDELVMPAQGAGTGYLFFINLDTGKTTRDAVRFRGTNVIGNIIPHEEAIILAVPGKVKAFRNLAAPSRVKSSRVP